MITVFGVSDEAFCKSFGLTAEKFGQPEGIKLTKSEMLFIRACKSKEPIKRVMTLRNRIMYLCSDICRSTRELRNRENIENDNRDRARIFDQRQKVKEFDDLIIEYAVNLTSL